MKSIIVLFITITAGIQVGGCAEQNSTGAIYPSSSSQMNGDYGMSKADLSGATPMEVEDANYNRIAKLVDANAANIVVAKSNLQGTVTKICPVGDVNCNFDSLSNSTTLTITKDK